jgi:hypothetical protein
MTRSRSIRRVLASLVALGLLGAGVAGCPQSKEAQAKKTEAQWEGTYDSTSAKETLQILSDHKAVMRNENGPADLTWEPTDQAGKFILHAPFPVEFFRTDDGGLRDATGVVWKKKG